MPVAQTKSKCHLINHLKKEKKISVFSFLEQKSTFRLLNSEFFSLDFRSEDSSD